VKEVTAWTIRTVTFYPIVLTLPSLVLLRLANIPHLLVPMGKLADVFIHTFSLLFEVSTYFGFKLRVS